MLGHTKIATTQIYARILEEKIADEIIVKIREQYPFIREVILSIYKLQAPIGNFQGKAGMTLHKKFSD